MLITRTVGLGGNHADYDAVNSWLFAQIPLNDQFVFNAISDVNQPIHTNRVLTANVGASIEINGNGYMLTTPTTGVQIGVSTLNGLLVKIHDMVINMVGINPANAITVTGITPVGTEIYNNFIYSIDGSSPNNNKQGIIPGNHTVSYYNIYNNVFYNLHVGIGYSGGGAGGDIPVPNQRFVENCIFFNCGSNTGYALVCEYVFQAWIQHRNISLFRNDGIVGRVVTYTDNTCTIDNCGTTDPTTFADLKALHPAQINNCEDSLVVSEQLLSTIFGNINFLRPVNGSEYRENGIQPINPTNDYDGILYESPYPMGPYQIGHVTSYVLNVIPVPDRGLKPLKVDFSWEFIEVYD